MAGRNANGGSPYPASPRAQVADAAAIAAGNQQQVVREQDRFMPIANVIRIMRRVLPTHAKISDDAKETVQECVSEYISFITSEANDRCQKEQRKTITAEDIIWAMSKLGFDNYIEPLTLFLHRYREMEGDHRGSLRGAPLLVKHRSIPALPLLSDLMNRNLHSPVPPPPQPFHYYDVNGILAVPPPPPQAATVQAQAPSYIMPAPIVNYGAYLNDGMGGGGGVGGGGYSFGMYGGGEGTSGGGGGGSSSQAASPPAPLPAVPSYDQYPNSNNSLNYKY